jgi:adenosylmethionine-8-amino-7-oxononanoate aminotransferase
MGGTIDGKQGDHVLLAPPFIIDDSHIDEIVNKLDSALQVVLK